MKKLLPVLLQPVETWGHCCSDVQLGKLVNQFNIICTKEPGFYGQQFFPAAGKPGDLVFDGGVPRARGGALAQAVLDNAVAYHYVSAEMQYVYRFYYALRFKSSSVR